MSQHPKFYSTVYLQRNNETMERGMERNKKDAFCGKAFSASFIFRTLSKYALLHIVPKMLQKKYCLEELLRFSRIVCLFSYKDEYRVSDQKCSPLLCLPHHIYSYSSSLLLRGWSFNQNAYWGSYITFKYASALRNSSLNKPHLHTQTDFWLYQSYSSELRKRIENKK